MTLGDKTKGRANAANACKSPGDQGQLQRSPIYCTGRLPAPLPGMNPLREVDNSGPIDQLVAELAGDRASQEYWIALVPGSSEAKGHHGAWDGPGVEGVYQARLDHALRILQAGVVRFIFVSGGSIDPKRPDFRRTPPGPDFIYRGVDPGHATIDL